MENKVKIILVDDHELVRASFKLLLEMQGKYEILAECYDEISYKNALKIYNPDIVLMDIKLTGVSGIELSKYTNQFHPKIKILFTSANCEANYIQLAVKSGCNGFVSKNCSTSELLEAIETINNGNDYYSKEVSKIMVEIFTNIQKNHSNSILSVRELEVLSLICEGKDFNTIGSELSISARTVETHKKNILSKLQLNNTVELVKYAIQNKLISQ